ncbi:MAG: hemerythrin family protein [Hyphomicrobiales bacterium]|nr:hemerythrin family protein [Hyphomicrobiales bacterium]
MTPVHWNPYLSVGHDGIDAEHQSLVDLLNALIARIDEGGDYANMSDCLHRLMDQTATHFRHEEEIMERADYPDRDYHCRQHASLMDEIRAFDRELAGGKALGPEVTNFIREWLIHHILKTDMRLGGYLEGREAAE